MTEADSRKIQRINPIAQIHSQVDQGSTTAEKLMMNLVLACGILLSALACIVYFTLKIDDIKAAHSMAIQERDRKIDGKDDVIQDLMKKVASLKPKVVEERGGLNGSYEPPVPLYPLSFPKDLSDGDRDKARISEIRRIFGNSTMPDDECERKYHTLSFSKRLQMESGLTNDPAFKEAVYLHQIIHLEAFGSKVLRLVFDGEPDIRGLQSLLSDKQNASLLARIKSQYPSMPDEEAWKKFGEQQSINMMDGLLAATGDADVISKFVSIVGRSRLDIRNAAHRDGPFDPRSILAAVGEPPKFRSRDDVFAFIAELVLNPFEPYPQ